ncbi:helix-turn-helix transcriptional regulator [Halorussus pelagicus]|uniref:helix-turn-helix transcriptional regulator n=1 Tax=Halorussus pelagicus TaxID=2505977 RepID=UPI000FFC3C49|nr:hypothetical protein [Halorussus pelagicus]
MASSEKDALVHALEHHELTSALQRGPQYKSCLAQELDVSSKTVYRRAHKLIESGLVKRCQNGYRLSNLGQLYCNLISELWNISGNISEIKPLLRDASLQKYPPYWFFAEIRTVCATEETPLRPIEELEAVFKNAEKLHGLLPVVASRFVKLLRRRVEASELSLELIVKSAAIDKLRQRDDEGDGMLMRDAQLWQIESVPYGLIIVIEPKPSVFLVMHNENGMVTGIIENQNPVATTWALQKFDQYLTDATSANWQLPA